jgi:hypothetical protein
MSSEELKKEWESSFDELADDNFGCFGESPYPSIKSFISSLLAKQQEEFVKLIEDWKKIPPLTEYQTAYNEALDDVIADIKSKLK